MPLIDYVRRDETEGEVREVLESVGYRKRSLMLEVVANHPPLLSGMVEMSNRVMHDGNVESATKEIVGVIVSQVNECDYCTASHRENLFKLRLPHEHILDVARGDYTDLPERQRAAATFAETAAREPTAVTEDDVDSLRAAGFDEEDVIEVLGVVGLFQATNTYASGAGVEPADRGDGLERYLDLESEDLDALATLWKST